MKQHFSLLVAGSLGCLLAISPFMQASAFREERTATLVPNKNNHDPLQESDISRFTDAISQIKNYYVQPISDKKLLEDAIRGMVNGLDPHSEYLDQDAYKSLMMTTTGTFGGLGIEVTGEYGVLKVISPIDDTPASRAGIKPGDYIVAINGKLVDDMTLSEAVESMRGKKGSPVSLTLIRKTQKKPITLRLIRDEIHITSVKSRLLEDGFGYVRISEFGKPTGSLVKTAIDTLIKENRSQLNGLIIDLRNNPGGLLDSAVEVADLFLDPKQTGTLFNQQIVYTEGRLSGREYSGKMTQKSRGDILNNAPIVILINEGSASASEIVSGALQDYHRALIIGTQSFGKGSVQTVLPLDNTHAIKLTTALYHTPSGRIIQNKGITPDILVSPLEIAANNKDNIEINPIREFELKGHLPGSESKNKNEANNQSKMQQEIAEDTLARSDFQLYEAIDILKTMQTLAQRGTNKNMLSQTPASAISQK